MLKVAIVGCGGIAHPHVVGWQAIPNMAQITALCDVNAAGVQRYAEMLGNKPERVSDFKALVKNKEIDAVDICLPHHLHKDAIIAAAEAGKHILCEKPLCNSLTEAAEITRAVEHNKVKLMCAHNQIFDPAVRAAKKAATQGAIGKIYNTRTCDCFQITNRPTEADWGWRAKLATAGGGCLIDTGYHPSYLLLYLAPAAAVEVTALTAHHSPNPIEGEDTAQLLVGFADGTTGFLITSWAHDVPKGTWQIHLVGEGGQIYGRGADLYIHPRGKEAQKIQLESKHAFNEEIAHFAQCVSSNETPVQTHVHGIDVLKLILGAYQSVKEKRTVKL
jgi:predicted dehydrogenase